VARYNGSLFILLLTLACPLWAGMQPHGKPTPPPELRPGMTLEPADIATGETLTAEQARRELRGRLSQINPRDPQELYAAARLAEGLNLPDEGRQLARQVLQFDHLHRGARRMLGQVNIAGRWLPAHEAILEARDMLEAGQAVRVLDEVLPQLQQAPREELERSVRLLRADALLMAGRTSESAEAYLQLARTHRGPAAYRYQAIYEILSNHPSGNYPLEEPYPASAVLLGDPQPLLEAGSVSFRQPHALDAALRDRAKIEIRTAQGIMDTAERTAEVRPDLSLRQLTQARRALDRADLLHAGIAETYRVDLDRLQIAAYRAKANLQAQRFDRSLYLLNSDPEHLQPRRIEDLRGNLEQLKGSLNAILHLSRQHGEKLAPQHRRAREHMQLVAELEQLLAREAAPEEDRP
jgi:hypothetical protein